MSEPQFIRNKNPHEVSMPEGSRVAASKSAEVGSPTVRQVLSEPDVGVVESFSESSRVEPPPSITPKVLNDVILARPKLDSMLLPDAQEGLNQLLPTENLDLDPEPEMNFPARLIYLKLENDKVRSELDTLEQQMTAGI